jgi:hypothetical protein
MAFYVIQDSLLLFSAIVLGDALRMLSVQFKKDPRLQVNQKTMSLHVLALFLHTFFVSLLLVARFKYFAHPTPHNEYIWNWCRFGMLSSGTISEFIVIYLFIEFSKPH